MSASTDAMYNSESRYIHQKLLIYLTDSPLEVTTSDYLISTSILEEASKVSSSPFGMVTSNELSASLYNDNGIFNPQNTSGEYYGRIKKGVKIEAFVRPDEATEWDRLGVFYVTEWQTSTSGTVVDITANDALYDVLNGDVPKMPVYRNIPLQEFVVMYFQLFGLKVIVDKYVDVIIPYVYTSSYEDNKSFLSDLMSASLCDCFCDHDGTTIVRSREHAESTRAVLTDYEQIKTISIRQSITNNYDSVVIEYHAGQESAEASLLSIVGATVAPGVTSFNNVSFTSKPVLSVRSVRVLSENQVLATKVSASASDVSFELRSTSNTVADIDLVGTTLETVISEVGNASEAALRLRNIFVQNKNRAESVYKYCDKYINSNVPILELSIRGNPRLSLGDKIEVRSDFYKVNYTGWLLKVKHEYNGAFNSSVVLMLDIRGEE